MYLCATEECFVSIVLSKNVSKQLDTAWGRHHSLNAHIPTLSVMMHQKGYSFLNHVFVELHRIRSVWRWVRTSWNRCSHGLVSTHVFCHHRNISSNEPSFTSSSRGWERHTSSWWKTGCHLVATQKWRIWRLKHCFTNWSSCDLGVKRSHHRHFRSVETSNFWENAVFWEATVPLWRRKSAFFEQLSLLDFLCFQSTGCCSSFCSPFLWLN